MSAKKNPLAEWLRGRKLFKGRAGKGDLLRWCHAGQLTGGLSVSLAATPDEVLGPLTHALGGEAKKLKVLDVRVRPGEPMELQVELPLAEPRTERWAVEDVPALVHNLNDLYRDAPGVGAGVVLGEFEDMWQLWVVSKPVLKELLGLRAFEPRNRRQLEGLFAPAEPEY